MGGAKIWFKREELAHTGAHKINNAVGQALLAKRLGLHPPGPAFPPLAVGCSWLWSGQSGGLQGGYRAQEDRWVRVLTSKGPLEGVGKTPDMLPSR